uniref:Outer dense fiber of sperm tails 3-like 2b n=1 Tax=Sinocyclocheilus rhinocerous TaxID=307959 RepID=A0A673JBJ4_9TELE
MTMSDTERKRPVIAGREKGPGPGRYILPPAIGFVGHDFTKSSSPAYSFHGRMTNNMHSIDCSPGPKYHIDDKLTRFERDGTPAYSIHGRMESQGKLEHTVPASLCSIHCKPSSHTMGYRTQYRSVDTIPAPNKYTLPSLMGSNVLTKASSASYSISGRCKSGGPSEDLSKTPGPGRYNRTDPSVYLPRQPAFSMLGRHAAARESTVVPDPGSRNPERVTVHKSRPPAFSLGIRHSEFVTPLIVD